MGYQEKPALEPPSYREVFASMTRTERTLFWIALLNFFAAALIAGFIGGDAFTGHEADGHYYLGAKGGKLTEVTKFVFNYSRFHILSQLLTFPLALTFWNARMRLIDEQSGTSRV